MPGFRNKRIALLVIAVLVSGLFIAAPWKGPQPEGAPMPKTVKGPNWGIDITGGSRILLQLQATQATIVLPETSIEYARNIRNRFRENLESPVSLILKENVERTGRVTIEIGKYISENIIKSYLKEGEEIVGYEKGTISEDTQEKVKTSLNNRVDPYGTLGAQFKPLGAKNQYLQFEVSLDLEKAKKLLGREGLPEILVENHKVVWSEHIRNVSKSFQSPGTGQERQWGVSFNLTEEGRERFATYTEGKAGYPGVIYLDRPADSVILFPENLVEILKNEASTAGLQELDYSEKNHKFRYKTRETSLGEGKWFYLQVPSVKIENQKLSFGSENYISSLIGNEDINQAILMGNPEYLSDNLIQNDNLVLNGTAIALENTTRMSGESHISWLNRVCGLKSWPILQPSVTGENLMEGGRGGLRITTGTGDAAEEEAEDLRIILSQRLPVKVAHISETEMGGRLSEGFLNEARNAGIVAFIIVGILVYAFYERFKIAIPLLLTMGCEVIITLGAVSTVPDGLMSIGLPGIGGLIAVIGTGVDHQIIIADEILGEKFSESKRLPIDRRTGRAFSIIFAAAATTIAAMIALATFGFGAMRGFAIVTLFGVLISVLITRPAYARIIGTLLEMEKEEEQ